MYSRKNVHAPMQHTFNPLHEINRLNRELARVSETNRELTIMLHQEVGINYQLGASLKGAEDMIHNLMHTNAAQGELIQALEKEANTHLSQVAIELATPPKSRTSSTLSSTSPTQLRISPPNINNIIDNFTSPQKFK